jgi:hypothetical protein
MGDDEGANEASYDVASYEQRSKFPVGDWTRSEQLITEDVQVAESADYAVTAQPAEPWILHPHPPPKKEEARRERSSLAQDGVRARVTP